MNITKRSIRIPTLHTGPSENLLAVVIAAVVTSVIVFGMCGGAG